MPPCRRAGKVRLQRSITENKRSARYKQTILAIIAVELPQAAALPGHLRDRPLFCGPFFLPGISKKHTAAGQQQPRHNDSAGQRQQKHSSRSRRSRTGHRGFNSILRQTGGKLINGVTQAEFFSTEAKRIQQTSPSFKATINRRPRSVPAPARKTSQKNSAFFRFAA